MEHDHSLPTHRIEAFSDGVFAIIVTLLVLDLKVPEIAQRMTTQATVQTLLTLLPQFLSFAMSFIIICIFWINHHQFFSVLKRSDRKLVWLNNLLLFWLCFIPFPTAFIGRYPLNVVAVMLFGSVLFLAALSFSIMIHYVFFRTHLFDDHLSESERKIQQRRSYVGIGLYLLSVLLAPISTFISFIIFIIVPLYYFIPRRFRFM